MRWTVQVDDMVMTVQGVRLSAGLRADLLQRVPGSVLCEVREDARQDVHGRSLQCESDVVEIDDVDVLELRRRILALFARAAVRRGAAIVHASAVSDGANGILLLGDYGAGKTSVALQMVAQGWRHIAGDTCLISAAGEVRVGSRVVLTRTPIPGAATTLQLPAGETRWEAAHCHGGPYESIRLQTVAVLDVNRPNAAPRVLTATESSDALFAAAVRIVVRRASSWGERLFDPTALSELRERTDQLAATVRAVDLTGSSQAAAEFLCHAEERTLSLDSDVARRAGCTA